MCVSLNKNKTFDSSFRLRPSNNKLLSIVDGNLLKVSSPSKKYGRYKYWYQEKKVPILKGQLRYSEEVGNSVGSILEAAEKNDLDIRHQVVRSSTKQNRKTKMSSKRYLETSFKKERRRQKCLRFTSTTKVGKGESRPTSTFSRHSKNPFVQCI